MYPNMYLMFSSFQKHLFNPEQLKLNLLGAEGKKYLNTLVGSIMPFYSHLFYKNI